MKTIICITLVAVLTFGALPVVAAQFDFADVRKNVDSALFAAGREQGKVYFYLVDRTTGMCFATISHGGLAKIDCEPLKKIEVIKTYLETGKLP